MFVIMVYNVGEKRVSKVLKKSRKYLYWVQNSVFEGDISPAKLKKLKMEWCSCRYFDSFFKHSNDNISATDVLFRVRNIY